MLTITACETIDKNFEIVDDKFEVGYFREEKDSICLAYHVERGVMMTLVPAKVKRVGINEKYIIVERVKTFGKDSTALIYYIINKDLFKKPDPKTTEKIIYGPFYKSIYRSCSSVPDFAVSLPSVLLAANHLASY